MKYFCIAVFCLLASLAQAQVTDMWADSTRLTTTWLKIQKDPYAKINIFEIVNDTTTSAGNEIFVGLEDDTTSTRRMRVKGQESLFISGLGVTHVYIKASYGSLPVRVRYH